MSARSRMYLATVAAAAMLTAAGCASSTGTAATDAAMRMPGQAARHHAQPPLPTTMADWAPVAGVLGRAGTLTGGTVYRVGLPRTDLSVTTYGVTVKPGLSLSGYAAFARYRDGTMLMGDLVITESEVANVTDALQANGIAQTALHKHLLQQTPPIWWTHIEAMGDPVTLAEGVKAALAATAIPPASPPAASQPPIGLDTAGIDHALGRHGTADGGIYKFSIARQNTITDGDGHILPPALGLTTAINFQPLGGNQAAINGDLALTAPEIQHVIQALRRGGISIVELHNHSLSEQPRLFYLHFWATGDGVMLARALRPALDVTNLVPPAS